MEIIVTALKHPNNKIRNLNLSNNSIGKYGMTLIAEALKDPNSKLVGFELRSNSVSPESVKGILEQAVKQSGRKITIQI